MNKNKFILLIIAVFVFIFGVAVLIHIAIDAELGAVPAQKQADAFFFFIGLLFLLTSIIVAYACPRFSMGSSTGGSLIKFISFILMFWFITRSIVVYGRTTGIFSNDAVLFTMYSIMQGVISKLVLAQLEDHKTSS